MGLVADGLQHHNFSDPVEPGTYQLIGSHAGCPGTRAHFQASVADGDGIAVNGVQGSDQIERAAGAHILTAGVGLVEGCDATGTGLPGVVSALEAGDASQSPAATARARTTPFLFKVPLLKIMVISLR
jgi:hypothetical protein